MVKVRFYSNFYKIIGCIILFWILAQVNFSQIINTLRQCNFFYLLSALLLMTVHLIVKFFRFHYILKKQNIIIKFKETLHFSLAAIYLSFITPGRVGELSKSYFIHKNTGVRLTKPLAGSIVDRFFDVYILLGTVLIGLKSISLFEPYSIVFPALFILLTILSISLFINKVRLVGKNILSHLSVSFFKNNFGFRHLQELFNEISKLFGIEMLYCLFVSIIAYLLFYGSCFFMAKSISLSLSYQNVAFFIACANILSFVPISFAGIGTREACLVYLFSIEKLTSESALAFSVLIFTLTYLFFGIVGFISFITLDKSSKETIDNA